MGSKDIFVPSILVFIFYFDTRSKLFFANRHLLENEKYSHKFELENEYKWSFNRLLLDSDIGLYTFTKLVN